MRSTDDYIYVCNMKTNTFRYTKAMVEEFDLPGEIIENAAAIWEEKVHEHDGEHFWSPIRTLRTDGPTPTA